MKVSISIGQVYDHESGEEYEVVRVRNQIVVFETSDGTVVHSDLDDVIDDIATEVLTPQDDAGDEDESDNH